MLALALLALAGVLRAQESEQLIGVLEAKIPQLMETEHVPGLSMALIRDSRIVWKGAFGVRIAGKPEKVDERTVFEAASMSKPLFSYAVLKLVEQGAFDLDRPLDSYLPGPYLPDQPSAKKITGRMVMLHRTGLPNWRERGWRNGGPLPILHEPDTRFTYSGEGYLYLQTAIEHLTRQPVNVWMEQALLKPLNMTDSSYVWRRSFEDNFAGGHDKEGNLKKTRRFYEQGNAAFSLYTTPTDFALFLIEIMKPDRSASHSLKAETVEKMTTLQVEPDTADERSRRSLGWVIAPEEKGGWVCHSGSNGSGFRCTSRFSMTSKSGCVIMTNSDGGRKVWESILAIIDSAPLAENPAPADPKVATWGAVQRTIKYDYRAMNPTSQAAGKIDIYVPLPLECPRQEIRYLNLSENGKQRVFTDVHGQKIAHYSFETLEAGHWVEMGYVVGITLKNMRWNANAGSAYPDAPVLTPQQRRRYLMPETNYSMEADLMRKAAAELTGDAATEFDKLVSIHDHIISKIRYVRDNTWDPAAVVLARGTGSCSEYNYVLSGLCRLAGLPTRCVGGSTNGFRALPTTDTVFHRWTEVFLSGYGWFPADCSRDANPIRGKRSHFGRVYVDAMVWCRQAGGDDDTLGWEYRAKIRVNGNNPGVRESHRTRWFVFHPQDQVEEAFDWFAGDGQGTPKPDLLECALLHWDNAAPENRLKIIRALAAAGRNEAIRRAAGLPEADNLRQNCIRELCDSPELAETVLEESRDLYRFRSWFRDNESNLLPTPDGRFKLTKAGIDIVTAANNHGGDYGPLSVADTAAWCEKAGLVCVGIGNHAPAAEEPRLVRIGPVRVAIVGMETTTPYFCAEEQRPGANYAGEDDLETFRKKMQWLGRWAEGRCDLLILTIHWGDNWVRQTQPTHREMARIAFENGIDLILGHSAHRLQGIKVLDGKAVIYDMGNLLFDCEFKPEGQRCGLFRLHLSADGVHKIEIIPTQVLNGRTVLAGHEEAQETLAEMRDLCSSLGTSLTIDEDAEGRSVGVIDIAKPRATPRPKPDDGLAFSAFPARGEEIEPAVSEAALVSEIPENACKVLPPVKLAPGVELLAFRLPATALEGGILELCTWWRVTGPGGTEYNARLPPQHRRSNHSQGHALVHAPRPRRLGHALLAAETGSDR